MYDVLVLKAKLFDIIIKNNGTIILGKPVEKIIIKDNSTTGIIINGNKKSVNLIMPGLFCYMSQNLYFSNCELLNVSQKIDNYIL